MSITIIKPVTDPLRQPKALPPVPRPTRKTREHCEFCRKTREVLTRILPWPRRK
jgi:hypothetical protein